jgi:thioredoxin reductase
VEFRLVQFAMVFYRNQRVVIVGAGDSACEEAHYLSKLCKKVTMLVRSENLELKIWKNVFVKLKTLPF